MKSEQLNNWLSVLANLGVLIGLIFVGVELRNSSNSVTGQIADSIAEGFNEFNLTVAADAELPVIFNVGLCDPSLLSPEEAVRFGTLMRALINQYYRIHTLYLTGALQESDWTGMVSDANGIIRSPGGLRYIQDNPLNPNFYQDVFGNAELTVLGNPDANWLGTQTTYMNSLTSNSVECMNYD